jgi:uncharacterized DUF497 family protein
MRDLVSTRFEWSQAKNRANQRKHRISFETASEVFSDPFALMAPEWVENGEDAGKRLELLPAQ